MSNRIAGVAYLKVDGAQYFLSGKLTVSYGSVVREGLSGLSGVAGYKETPRVPSIEGEFFTTADISLKNLEAVTDATITAEMANGKNYVLSGAWSAGTADINAAEGTFTMKFEGLKLIEVENEK